MPTALGVGYPVSAGQPNLSGVTVPVIWGKRFLEFFYQHTFLNEITDNQYASELKGFGDRFIIPGLPEDVVIGNYIDGQDLVISPVALTFKELFINLGTYFAFSITDVQKKQSGWRWDGAFAEHMAKKMKIFIEKSYINTNYATGDAYNMGTAAGAVTGMLNFGASGSPRGIGPTGVVQLFTDMHQALEENNVPEEDIYVLCPPWLVNVLKNSTLKFAYATGDKTSPLRNGLVGEVDGFKIFNTNLITPISDTYNAAAHNCYNVMFGIKKAVSFITQMTETETKRNPYAPADIVSGIQIYGYKTFLPKGLGNAYITYDSTL